MQAQPYGFTVQAVTAEQSSRSAHAECGHNQKMPMTWGLRQQDLVTKAVSEALRSTNLNNLVVCAIQNALSQQKGNTKDIIKRALQLAGYGQHSAGLMEPSGVMKDNAPINMFVFRNEAPFRQIDNAILLGIKEMLASGQLNRFLMGIMKELLVFGELDSFIKAGIKQIQHSCEGDIATMVELSMAVPTRQLDDIVLNTFSELMCSGDLDDTIIGTISDVLQSRTLDGIISDIFPQLAKKVILLIAIATVHIHSQQK